MAGMNEHNIYRAYNFILDLGGGTVGYFTQVNFMGINVPYYEYREGGAGPAVRKLPGRVSYNDIELKWGLTESTEMWDWLMSAVKGEVIRKNISIILRDTDGQNEVTRWDLENAFPCCWRGAQLNALSNEAAIETLCITHEGLTRA